jgi:penicillin amidase
MRRLLLRWVLRPLLIVSLPVAVILAGGLYWLSTSLPQTTGTVTLDGLKDPVDIVRDQDGVPHIFAKNDADAAFALGFLHAQDRLWQMEQMRRVGSGRLSELFGEATLPLDRFRRTLGLERLAEQTLSRLDPTMRAELDAYTAGVNAYLKRHRGAWPPEFTLLGIAPAPWRPVDSLLWGELMGLQLSGNWHSELLRARLLKRLTPAQVDQLWPPYPGDGPTTLATNGALYRNLPLRRLAALFGAFDGHGASNAWVLDGAHSETGKPILANDPHLGLELPILWYLVSIETPTLHLAGATVPGVPLMILGHNDHVAWGMTTTGGDIEDLFVEKLDPGDPSRYLTPDGPVPFRTRTEIIAVHGKAPVTLTVRETRHGPVISDTVEELGKATERGTVVALAATWLDPDNRIAQSLYRIAHATDWASFTAALQDFNAPEQNVTYADVDGHIGFYTAGWVPVRKAGDGRLPVPGWTGEYDWTGYIPFAELPHGLDPASGRFVNANNKVTPPGYPHLITTDGYDWPYRARRIESLLAARPQGSLNQSAAIQADIVSPAAQDLLPLMTDIQPAAADAKAMLERLKQWDGKMDRSRPEPLVFAAWLRELERGLLADKLGDVFPSFWEQRAGLVKTILTAHREWCARKGATPAPDDCRARIAEAYGRALGWLAERYGRDMGLWRWGDAHRAQLVHRIFARIPVIDRLVNLRLPVGGGDYTIDRAAYRVENERAPFADVHGAGYRAIYDLADLSRSRFMIATGQSGNPFSSHFTDLAERWRDVDYVTISGNRDALIQAGGDVLTLVPR